MKTTNNKNIKYVKRVFIKRNFRLKNNGFRSYTKYLNSDTWKAKKQEFDQYLLYNSLSRQCVQCGKKYDLQLHHKTYIHICKERMDELCYLCGMCHEEVSKNTFQAISDELFPIDTPVSKRERKRERNKKKSEKKKLKRLEIIQKQKEEANRIIPCEIPDSTILFAKAWFANQWNIAQLLVKKNNGKTTIGFVKDQTYVPRSRFTLEEIEKMPQITPKKDFIKTDDFKSYSEYLIDKFR